MKMIQIFRAALMLVLLGLLLPAHADDIDIYRGKAGSDVPNVLIILDNAASFDATTPACSYADGSGAASLSGKVAGTEQCALYNTIKSLPTNDDGSALINLGFMVYSTTGIAAANPNSGCASSNNGGCLLIPLTGMSASGKTYLLNWIKGWQMNDIKANNQGNAMAMQEAWAYYAGKTGVSTRNYAGIQPASGCQKNFLIYIGNAYRNNTTPGDNGSPSNELTNAPPVAGVTTPPNPDTTPIVIPTGSYGLPPAYNSCGTYSGKSHTDTSGLYADEWARYMSQTDLYPSLDGTQSITTYTIGALGPTCDAQYPALLQSMALKGGGKYFAADANSDTSIADAVGKVFNEIQAVNSVFSSASLPVSVNAQGTYLNQIFLGMFRPDSGASPRWLGNIKQYQFILTSSGLQLGDSTGVAALNAVNTTGFISPNAISFWTSKDTSKEPDSTGGFFKNDPHGAGLAYDSPDGDLVEKGGAAQQLRLANLSANYAAAAGSASNPRRLYTSLNTNYANCLGATPAPECSLAHSSNIFATSNSALSTAIESAMPGVLDATGRNTLINWVRGQDNCTNSTCVEKGPGSPYTVRPSIHGDVLHSRPVVINYGDSRGLVVYYGANDGVFRAVNGSQTAVIGSVPAGGELWGLVLQEHFGQLKRQRDNSPELKLPSTTLASAQPKDYFVDGSAGAYQLLKADGTIDKAYLYLTMRRGGRFIYALDVSDPTAPTVLWRVKSTDSVFAELGQTWSRPRVTLIKGYVNPVLVFGAGYDSAEDAEPPTSDTMGRGIFVVDAITGVLVWKAVNASVSSACAGGTTTPTGNSTTRASCEVAGMNWAIPADISFVDRDNDGKIDRFYAADLGGNVWRVDLEPTGSGTPDTWQVTKLAALGCDAGVCPSGTTPRKFFYPPNVVPVGATGVANSYDAVLLGSGDREHPLKNTATGSAYNVVNRFYMLKDTRTGKSAKLPTLNAPITESTLFDATALGYTNTGNGFYMTLVTGEKVVNASITVTGTTFFGTNRPKPDTNSCIPNLGEAKGYALNPFTATFGSSIYDGGGLPPTPVAGIVSIKKADGSTVDQSFCVGCGGASAFGTGGSAGGDTKSTLGAVDLNKAVPKKPRRTYWYKR